MKAHEARRRCWWRQLYNYVKHVAAASLLSLVARPSYLRSQLATCNVQRATCNLVVLASNALTAFSPFNRPTD